MVKVEPRNVSPILQMMRNFLLGRKHTNALRFEDYVAARTQPPPNLPTGSADKMSANYYYTRDARREVAPPNLLAINSAKGIKAIASGEKSVEASKKKSPLPGKIWQWD